PPARPGRRRCRCRSSRTRSRCSARTARRPSPSGSRQCWAAPSSSMTCTSTLTGRLSPGGKRHAPAEGGSAGGCNTCPMATSSRSLNIGRLGEIAQVAVKHGFGYLIEGRRGSPPDPDGPTARGRHLREMLDELGPTFVKFGQLLSTRPDIVPPDIIAELRALQ